MGQIVFYAWDWYSGDNSEDVWVEVALYRVVPNTAPVAACQNVIVAAIDDCTVAASVDNGSFDPDGDQITVTQEPAGPYPLGTTEVTLNASDGDKTDSCTAVVTVVAKTQVSFVGLQTYWIYGPAAAAPTITAQLSSVCAACVTGQSINFFVDTDGNGSFDEAPVTMPVGADGKATITLPGVGIYSVKVGFAGTEFCLESESEPVIVSVVFRTIWPTGVDAMRGATLLPVIPM